MTRWEGEICAAKRVLDIVQSIERIWLLAVSGARKRLGEGAGVRVKTVSEKSVSVNVCERERSKR